MSGELGGRGNLLSMCSKGRETQILLSDPSLHYYRNHLYTSISHFKFSLSWKTSFPLLTLHSIPYPTFSQALLLQLPVLPQGQGNLHGHPHGHSFLLQFINNMFLHLSQIPYPVPRMPQLSLFRPVHLWITVISSYPSTSNLPTFNNTSISPAATPHLPSALSSFL